MLDNKRVKEAENNVKNYLAEGLIKKIAKPELGVREVLVKNSKESLEAASILYKSNHSHLWTIVCSYYAMYYIAKAVLYKLGYKVGSKISHKVTADALIVYIRKRLKHSLIEVYEEARQEATELAGLRADELMKYFDYERAKRGRIQYSTTEQAKKTKAQTSLKRAKEFVFEMEKLLV